MEAKLSRPEYERLTAETRDARMAWWREARFGMFIHYGLHTVLGRHEWVMAIENWDIGEYEKLAEQFQPKPGCAREWVKLASEAGMKYAVLTTRHHEGFCLWDSEVNPFNVVKAAGAHDVVKEFVEACREFGLKTGFYFSLMDWYHPDSWRCAFDHEARARFQDYLCGMLRELLGGTYGKIDILWYDVSRPMESHEGWGSLRMNQMVRELQPDILINNRSKLAEDFSTPEENLNAAERDWESCMTFNGISWGYLDSEQALPYSYSAQQILTMLNTVCRSAGNLLLNIGPMADGTVPAEAVEPLQTVGRWLQANGEAAVYGKLARCRVHRALGSGQFSQRGETTVYLWQQIRTDRLIFGGFMTKLKSIKVLPSGTELKFTQDERQIIVEPPTKELYDPIANITLYELEFEEPFVYRRGSAYPQLHKGEKFL